MRKFKNKNRQKRKYTRKHVSTSTSQAAQVWFVGLLPLLILSLAIFMTLLISLSLPSQKISFQTPEIPTAALTQPFQNIPSLIDQAFETIASGMAGATQISGQFASALYEGVTEGAQTMVNLLTQVYSGLVIAVQSVIHTAGVVSETLIFAGQVVLNAIGQAITFLFNLTIQLVTQFAQILYSTTQTVIDGIISVLQAIAHAIQVASDAIIYFFGTPFRVLHPYWEQFKPYLIIFGEHVKMAGDAFVLGLSYLSNLTSVVTK